MSELRGYNGKLAFINLTSKEIEIKDLNSEDAKNYIGGCGLSAKITYDLIKEEDYETLKKRGFLRSREEDPRAGEQPHRTHRRGKCVEVGREMGCNDPHAPIVLNPLVLRP